MEAEKQETHVVIVQERDEDQERSRSSVGVKVKTNQETIFNMQSVQDIVSDGEV